MTSGQKTALSLLVSIVVFAGCVAYALLGGFDFIEIKYYEPRIVQTVNARLDTIAQKYDAYIEDLEDKLAQYALDPSVSSYIEREATEDEAEKRGVITGRLFDSIPGLEGIRIVEQNGAAVHFSTFNQDVLSESDDLIAYSDYTKLNEIPFYILASADNGSNASTKELMVKRCQIYFDSAKERLIFSLPYFDKFTAYRGSLLFYVSGDDFMRVLINESIVSLNTRCVLIAPKSSNANTQTKKNCGVVFDIPFTGKESIKEEIQNKWAKDLFGLEQLVRNENSEETLVLVTSQASKYAQMGWVCDENDFSFNSVERMLILLCVFITVFLIVFLLFNIKHDDMTVIRGRVRKFQKALLTEYVERRNASDWKELTKELNVRRQDVNDEIKKSLGKRGKKHSKEVDELLDESWNELFAAVGGRTPVAGLGGAGAARVVSNEAQDKLAPVNLVPEHVETIEADIEEIEPVEEIEADVEEIAPLEEAEADVEEIEPLEEVEADAEEIEPLEEVEADVEEIVPAEEIEAGVEEIEPLEEAEAGVEEIAPAEEIEAGVEEIEPLEEAEAGVEEIVPAEEIEAGVEEVEPLEEVEADVEEVEPLEEAEAGVEEIEPLEETDTESDVEEISAEEEVSAEDTEFVEETETGVEETVQSEEPAASVEEISDGEIEPFEENAASVEESESLEEEIEVPVVEEAPEPEEDESYKAESRAMQASIDQLIARMSGNKAEVDSEETGSSENLESINMEKEVPVTIEANDEPENSSKEELTDQSSAAPRKKSLLERASMMRSNSSKEDSAMEDEMAEFFNPKKTAKVDEEFAENFFVVTPDFSGLDEKTEREDGASNID